MTPKDAFAICEGIVRRVDSDRHLATLFAPAAKRSFLYAMYAFNHELARACEMARDSFAAEIRLQWWRDAIGAAGKGRAPAHPVAVALAAILARDAAQSPEFEALVDARLIESSPAPFPTVAAMERHALETSARLMRMAASTIVGVHASSRAIDYAGIAYGLTGMLRGFHFHARRGRIFLPADLLVAEGLSTAAIGSGKNSSKLKCVFDQVGLRALEYFQRARQNEFSRAMISAVLPASLVPAYLSRMAKRVDLFHDGTDTLGLRKQLIMLRAALLERL